MQNQKGISTLVGIIIIVVVAVVLFGGVFGYQYFATPKENNQQQNQPSTTNAECSNLYWFDNTSSNPCETQKQFCGAYMYYGLRTFATQSECRNEWNIASGRGSLSNQNITIKPYEYIKNSFNTNSQTFSVKTADGQLFSVMVIPSTKIYYTVDGEIFNVSFLDFAKSRNLGLKLIGIAAIGDETIKGFLSSDGKTIEAVEIFWANQ